MGGRAGGLLTLCLPLVLACAAASAQPASGYLAERSSQVLGQEVRSRDGHPVQLQDIVVHARTGEFVHAVAPGGRRLPIDALELGVRPEDAAPPRSGAAAPTVRLRQLVGAGLENRHGDSIGTVEEAVLDLAGRRVDYLVVLFSGDWLGTPKRTAIPLQALSAGRADAAWVLDADPARALSLPDVRQEDLRRINEGEVAERMHRLLQQSPWASGS